MHGSSWRSSFDQRGRNRQGLSETRRSTSLGGEGDLKEEQSPVFKMSRPREDSSTRRYVLQARPVQCILISLYADHSRQVTGLSTAVPYMSTVEE